MVLALVAVGAGAALIVGVFAVLTAPAIERARIEALHKALMGVLPPHANDPPKESFVVEGVRFWPARDAHGRLLALAWEVVAPDGYSGPIRLLVGVRPDGVLTGVRVIEHRETPGLGDGIVRNQAWIASFVGRSLANARWEVKKYGGDFDQFTGATITPRAVVHAVGKALAFFAAHREAIVSAAKRGER